MKCPLKPIKTIVGASNVTKENYDFSDLRQCIKYVEDQQSNNVVTDFGQCDRQECMAFTGGRCRMMPG